MICTYSRPEYFTSHIIYVSCFVSHIYAVYLFFTHILKDCFIATDGTKLSDPVSSYYELVP